MLRCIFCFYSNKNLVKWPYNRDPVSNQNEPEGVLLVKTNNQMLELYWLFYWSLSCFSSVVAYLRENVHVCHQRTHTTMLHNITWQPLNAKFWNKICEKLETTQSDVNTFFWLHFLLRLVLFSIYIWIHLDATEGGVNLGRPLLVREFLGRPDPSLMAFSLGGWALAEPPFGSFVLTFLQWPPHSDSSSMQFTAIQFHCQLDSIGTLRQEENKVENFTDSSIGPSISASLTSIISSYRNTDH